MSGLVPSDLRKTNLVIDDTLLAGKIVANDAEFGNLTIRSGTVSANQIVTQTFTTQQVVVTTTGTSTGGSLLIAENVSSIVAGQIPQFISGGSTVVRSIPKSVFMGNTLSYFFMDGSDGNVTISGGTTTLTRDMYYDTLTIDSTGVLIPAGFCIFCQTALINNGAIRMNGGNGSDGSGASGGTGGTAATSTGALVSGQSGKTGGAPAANGSNAVGTATSLGGLGGVGGNSATQTGGTVTAGQSFIVGLTYLKNVAFWELLFRVNAIPATVFGGDPGGGGSGGAGGVGAGGGGGGAGGGWVMVVASSVSGSGTFEANGGNGGNGFGGVGGGGGGGGGGVVYILSLSNSITSSQVLVNGGTGGTGFASGASGNTGVYQNNVLTS